MITKTLPESQWFEILKALHIKKQFITKDRNKCFNRGDMEKFEEHVRQLVVISGLIEDINNSLKETV